MGRRVGTHAATMTTLIFHAVPDEERNIVPGEVGTGRLGGELGDLEGAADGGKDADGEDEGELDLFGEGHLEGPDDGDRNRGEGDVKESGVACKHADLLSSDSHCRATSSSCACTSLCSSMGGISPKETLCMQRMVC